MFLLLLLVGTCHAGRYQDFIDACMAASTTTAGSTGYKPIYKENSCYQGLVAYMGARNASALSCRTNQAHTILGAGRIAMFTRPAIVQIIFDHIVTTPSVGHYINSAFFLVNDTWMIEDTSTGQVYPIHRVGSPGMPAFYNHNQYSAKIPLDRALATYPTMLHRWTLPYSSFEDWTTAGISTAVCVCEYPNPWPRHIQFAIRDQEFVSLVADKCEVSDSVSTEYISINCGRRCSKLPTCNGFIYSASTHRCELTFLLYADCVAFGGIITDTSDTAYYDRVMSGEIEQVGAGPKF